MRARISDPLGVDAYVLVCTDEPIPNPGVFNQPGVMTRGNKNVGKKGKDPYSVLFNIGSKTRGPIATPSAWNIRTFTIKSVP